MLNFDETVRAFAERSSSAYSIDSDAFLRFESKMERARREGTPNLMLDAATKLVVELNEGTKFTSSQIRNVINRAVKDGHGSIHAIVAEDRVEAKRAGKYVGYADGHIKNGSTVVDAITDCCIEEVEFRINCALLALAKFAQHYFRCKWRYAFDEIERVSSASESKRKNAGRKGDVAARRVNHTKAENSGKKTLRIYVGVLYNQKLGLNLPAFVSMHTKLAKDIAPAEWVEGVRRLQTTANKPVTQFTRSLQVLEQMDLWPEGITADRGFLSYESLESLRDTCNRWKSLGHPVWFIIPAIRWGQGQNVRDQRPVETKRARRQVIALPASVNQLIERGNEVVNQVAWGDKNLKFRVVSSEGPGAPRIPTGISLVIVNTPQSKEKVDETKHADGTRSYGLWTNRPVDASNVRQLVRDYPTRNYVEATFRTFTQEHKIGRLGWAFKRLLLFGVAMIMQSIWSIFRLLLSFAGFRRNDITYHNFTKKWLTSVEPPSQ